MVKRPPRPIFKPISRNHEELMRDMLTETHTRRRTLHARREKAEAKRIYPISNQEIDEILKDFLHDTTCEISTEGKLEITVPNLPRHTLPPGDLNTDIFLQRRRFVAGCIYHALRDHCGYGPRTLFFDVDDKTVIHDMAEPWRYTFNLFNENSTDTIPNELRQAATELCASGIPRSFARRVNEEFESKILHLDDGTPLDTSMFTDREIIEPEAKRRR